MGEPFTDKLVVLYTHEAEPIAPCDVLLLQFGGIWKGKTDERARRLVGTSLPKSVKCVLFEALQELPDAPTGGRLLKRVELRRCALIATEAESSLRA